MEVESPGQGGVGGDQNPRVGVSLQQVMGALEEGHQVGVQGVGGEGGQVAEQQVGVLAVEGLEVVEVEERSERISRPPHPVYKVVSPDRAPVLDSLQLGRLEYEDWIAGPTGLPSELLGTVAGGVPAVHCRYQDVRL